VLHAFWEKFHAGGGGVSAGLLRTVVFAGILSYKRKSVMFRRPNTAFTDPLAETKSMDPGTFPTTRWSRVRAAGDSVAEGHDAFAILCRDYWSPVFAFVRRAGFSASDAEDLAQGFFLHLLEHRTVRRADSEVGKFRSFLLGALKYYLANEAERAGRQKRGGTCEIISLDDPSRRVPEPSCESEADNLFEETWAQEVMHRALVRLREKFASEQRAEVFDALQGFLDGTCQGTALEDIAGELNLSGGALRTAISRLRKQFAEQLRLEIARTVSAPHEVEEEFRHLRLVLTARS
jgi:RNA polymerase sigma-70 factor (ECF subfamily)